MDKICICGGGNLGQTLAGVLSSREDIELFVLTRKPEKWKSKIKVIYGNEKIIGKPEIITDKPSEVIPQSNIIIMTLPSYAKSSVLEKISPYTNKGTWIGSFPGTGGFEWIVKKFLGNNVTIFGLQRVPYICRLKTYGKETFLLGKKKYLCAASLPKKNIKIITQKLEKLLEIPVKPLNNFLAVTLTPSNPILHPSRLYGLFKDWKEKEYYQNEIFFYKEWDLLSSKVLINCDNELQKLCLKIPLDLSGILSLLDHYEVKNEEELTKKISTIESLKTIKAPMIKINDSYIPDFKSRYFTEDIPYGLLIIRAIAELAEIETPSIDMVLSWAQKHMKKQYLINGKLIGKDLKETAIPQQYGINSLEELINLENK